MRKKKSPQPIKPKKGVVKHKPSKKHPLLAILPQMIIIGICIGTYYAMVNYYLFFQWGIYLYYVIKIIVGYEILSAATRSLLLPLAALIIGLVSLFTNNLYMNTLMSANTAWELIVIALIGVLLTIAIHLRTKKG